MITGSRTYPGKTCVRTVTRKLKPAFAQLQRNIVLMSGAVLLLMNAVSPSSLIAQTAVQTLTVHGYENVAQQFEDGHLLITFENRIYRSEAAAIADVLLRVHSAQTPYHTLSLLVRHHDMPVLLVTTQAESLSSLLNGSMSYEEWVREASFSLDTKDAELRIRNIVRENRSLYRIDIPTGLGVRYQLGNYNAPFQFAFDLEPEVRIQLRRGMSASARFALPLYNNFDTNTFARPVRLMLTQEFIPDRMLYTSFSAGMFGRNRAGLHAQMKKLFYEDLLGFGFDLGYTTFTGLSGNVRFPSVEQQDYLFYTATFDLRWRRYDLTARVRAGNFLYQDTGWIAEVERQFGEVTGALFMIQTTTGNNAGFRFSLPIFPKRYTKPGRVRLRPERHFSLSYRYKGNDFNARDYETDTVTSDLIHEWYPSFLKKELSIYLKLNRD